MPPIPQGKEEALLSVFCGGMVIPSFETLFLVVLGLGDASLAYTKINFESLGDL